MSKFNTDQKIISLRKALGYVENGTSTEVLIFQDDATNDFIIKVGKNRIEEFWGQSLSEALDGLAEMYYNKTP